MKERMPKELKERIRDYVKRLGDVLRTESVEKLVEFVVGEGLSQGFENAPYEVQELTLYKMIANRTDMPKELHDKAVSWLLLRGYSTKIY